MLREKRAEEVNKIVARYPEKRSAILPLLEMAQKLGDGHVSPEAMVEIAEIIGVAPSYVHSVATFYSMFHFEPVGKRRLYVCRTLSCALAGADELMGCIQEKLGIGEGETTPDGKYSLFTMECLGACGTAPVIMVNNESYVESVDRKKLQEILDQPF